MRGVSAAESIGKTYGQLTVLRITRVVKYPPTPGAPYGTYCTQVECRCSCGNLKEFVLQNVKRGLSTSCGCFLAYQIGDIIGRFTLMERLENSILKVKCNVCQTLKTTDVRNLWRGSKRKCCCKPKYTFYRKNTKRWNVVVRSKYVGSYKTREEAQKAVDQHLEKLK